MAPVSLHYEKQGKGPPLLLIGGFTENASAFNAYVGPLAKHFTLIVPENRGSGRSPSPKEPYTIEEMASDMKALLDLLQITNVSILAHSMGTLIGMQLALSHPSYVKKLLLSGPFAHLPEVSAQNLKTELELFSKGLPEELLYQLHAVWVFSNHFFQQKGNLEKFVERRKNDPYKQSKEGILGQAHALLSCDLRSRLKEIAQPVHLFVGAQDISTPSYLAQEMGRKIPRCTLRIIEGMGHGFLQEIPELLTPLILEYFLATY